MTQSHPKYDKNSFILVVDDDNTLLKFFKIHLNKFFSKVIVVKNAKEAIDTLWEKEIDLVITDINMPRMDGFQLQKRIRKYDGAIPILFISGALLNSDQEEFVKESDGYLRKPFSIEQLHDFISNGLEKRSKMKALSELMSDKKNLRDLLDGKISLEKSVKKSEHKNAEQILTELNELTNPESGAVA
ncbi:MAG: response regulator [Deltaproteobacteria bacterium]|nr:response regulator [Deltaproteobacteria bacterium]